MEDLGRVILIAVLFDIATCHEYKSCKLNSPYVPLQVMCVAS